MTAKNQRQLSETQEVSGVQSQAMLAMEERMRITEEQLKDREAEIETVRERSRKMEASYVEK